MNMKICVSHTIFVVILSQEKCAMALQVLGVCLHQMCLFHVFPKDKKLTLFNTKQRTGNASLNFPEILEFIYLLQGWLALASVHFI